MVNPSLLAADGTPPYHLAGRGVEGGCDEARAPLAARPPPAVHGGSTDRLLYARERLKLRRVHCSASNPLPSAVYGYIIIAIGGFLG